MRKIPRNLDIAHLGLNFWRKLIAESPSYCFESNNALLLCLDDNGIVLFDFFLTHKGISCSSVVMRACVSLAKASGASALVRVQKGVIDYIDPFQIESLSTKALYEAADLYDLRVAEVVLPCMTTS